MTEHKELIKHLRELGACGSDTADMAADALESQALEMEGRERLFWEACSSYGKAGEVIYMTYKTKRDAAMAAKGASDA